MRQKTLIVHEDNGDFRVVLLLQSRLRIRQKYFIMYGEYA
jgi:hypothetical protein